MDDSAKAFAITPTTSAEETREQIVKRTNLEVHDTFSLFEVRDDWERCLDPDERPAELQKEWDSDKKSKPKFVFKKKIFLKDDEREMKDTVAREFVYLQAVHDVIHSVYNVSQEDALKLAGLQAQITYGKPDPSIHKPGFMTKMKEVENFVPHAMYSDRKGSDWESAILKEHAKGFTNQDDARNRYLEIVKGFPLYGTTFFPPCKSAGNKALPSRVVIGVNFEGIRLLKVRNKELISEHLYTEICSWASSSSTFAFEFGNQSDSQKYTFETKMGAIVAATVQTYIDILVQMLKNGEEDAEEV